MSLTPPPPVTRRDWTLPIIAGVVAIVVVLAVCLVGSAMAFVALRRDVPSAPLVPTPSVRPTGQSVKSGPECLIGDWLETSYTLATNVGTTSVRFTGKGAVSKFSADGSLTQRYENVVYAGTGDGNRYEIVINGSLKLTFSADATKISYSNPATSGTNTFKKNGTVTTVRDVEAKLTPESYTCQGDELSLADDATATTLKRI